jgi:exosome complex exonuclease RRP6
MYLDEYLGRNATSNFAIQMQNTEESKKSNRSIPADIYHAAYLPKPQLRFKRKPDNTNSTPWIPLLHRKPNAQVPLDKEYLRSSGFPASYESPHPYRFEIAHLSYPKRMFEDSTPIQYRSFEDTPVQWVATQQDLDSLVQDLKSVTEFAVDLEHHDYRSFAGFLCLMQISTREKDYIIDVLILREELEILNDLFTNPTVVKVLIF